MLFSFVRPSLPEPDEWVPYLKAAYEQRYFSNFGPIATALADRMTTAYLQPGYAGVLCSSNTAGLTAVLQALGMGGKKVALPDFTFAATIQAVFAANGVPVVCDVDSETWELCPRSLAEAFEAHPDIGCVLHVRPFGLIRSLEAVRALCRERAVPLVVDAAAGLGAPADEATFGSSDGEIEVFSLHATKVFAIGEGGFIGAPRGLMPSIKAAMNFGFNADRSYTDGSNAKVDEFRAAIGMAMFERMGRIVDFRRRHAAFYDVLFRRYPETRCAVNPGQTPWASYPVLFDRRVTTQTIGAFADSGIEIKKYYWPGVRNGYKGRRTLHSVALPISESVQDRIACFPVYSDFTPELGNLLSERIERAIGPARG